MPAASLHVGTLVAIASSASPLHFADNDGDLIVISSDEELVQALDQFDGSVFRLYLKKSEHNKHPIVFA